jgi:ribosomal protein L29
MKLKEIRDLTTPELGNKLSEAYQEMFNLRFQLASRQLSNYQRISDHSARARACRGGGGQVAWKR